jgi:hypothetical protein
MPSDAAKRRLTEPLLFVVAPPLPQRIVDRGELGVELGAEPFDHCKNGTRALSD